LAFNPKPFTNPTKININTKCKCAFSFLSITPSLMLVFMNKCTNVLPTHAVIMGYPIPFKIGSNPLFIGRNAPPHPLMVPHMMGPKRGKERREGAMAALAARVNVRTTFARTHSYSTMMPACDIDDIDGDRVEVDGMKNEITQ